MYSSMYSDRLLLDAFCLILRHGIPSPSVGTESVVDGTAEEYFVERKNVPTKRENGHPRHEFPDDVTTLPCSPVVIQPRRLGLPSSMLFLACYSETQKQGDQHRREMRDYRRLRLIVVFSYTAIVCIPIGRVSNSVAPKTPYCLGHRSKGRLDAWQPRS